jgi:hypothetical protein
MDNIYIFESEIVSAVDALVYPVVGYWLCGQIPIWPDWGALTDLRIAVIPKRRPACQFELMPKSAMQPPSSGNAAPASSLLEAITFL